MDWNGLNTSKSGAHTCSSPGSLGACTRVKANAGWDVDVAAWPADGSLPCSGDLESVPVVLDVHPRFARRRGGTLITVTGLHALRCGCEPGESSLQACFALE